MRTTWTSAPDAAMMVAAASPMLNQRDARTGALVWVERPEPIRVSTRKERRCRQPGDDPWHQLLTHLRVRLHQRGLADTLLEGLTSAGAQGDEEHIGSSNGGYQPSDSRCTPRGDENERIGSTQR
jgi:hypothetical protein